MARKVSNPKSEMLRLIYKTDGISRGEIAQKLQLSMPTVLQNLRELQSEGLIQEEGKYASSGGRKAGIICGVPGIHKAIGCAIEKHRVTMSIVDLLGNELASKSLRMSLGAEVSYCIELRDQAHTFAQENGVDFDALLGIGIALPGVINHVNNQAELYIRGRRIMQLSMLSEQFSMPCHLLRISDAGAIAEGAFDSEQGTFLYISLSSTVGGTFIQNGQIYKGNNGRSNRIGHLTLVPDGHPCYCGKKGCTSAYCSANVLTDITPNGDEEEFFAMLEAGDPKAEALWQDYLRHLALLVNNMHFVYDCNIVLGGSIGGRMKSELPQLQKYIAELDPYGHMHAAYVSVCHYANRISAIGAAISITTDFFQHYNT